MLSKKTNILPRQPWVEAKEYLRHLDAAKASAKAALRDAGVSEEDIPFRLPNYGRLSKLFELTPPIRKGGVGDNVSYGNVMVTLPREGGPVTSELNLLFTGEKVRMRPRVDRGKKPTVNFQGPGSTVVPVMAHVDELFKKTVEERTWWCRSVKKQIVEGVGRQPKTAAEVCEELRPLFYKRFPYYSSEPSAANFFDPQDPRTCYATNEDWQTIRRAWSGAYDQEAICPGGGPILLKNATIPNLVQTIIQSGEDAGKPLPEPIFRAAVRIISTKVGDNMIETGVDALFSDRRHPITATTFRNIPITPANIDTHEDIRSGVAGGLVTISFCISTLAVSLPAQLKMMVIKPDANTSAAAEAAFGDLFLSEEEKAENLATIRRLEEAAREGGPSGGAGGAGCASGTVEGGLDEGLTGGAPDELGDAELAELAELARFA